MARSYGWKDLGHQWAEVALGLVVDAAAVGAGAEDGHVVYFLQALLWRLKLWLQGSIGLLMSRCLIISMEIYMKRLLCTLVLIVAVSAAHAAPVYHPAGSNLTSGDVSNGQSIMSDITNPAASAVQLERDGAHV